MRGEPLFVAKDKALSTTHPFALAQTDLSFMQHSDDLFRCVPLPAHLDLLQELDLNQILPMCVDHF